MRMTSFLKSIQIGIGNTSQMGDNNKSEVKYNRSTKNIIKKEKKKSFIKGLLSGLLINFLWYIIEYYFL